MDTLTIRPPLLCNYVKRSARILICSTESGKHGERKRSALNSLSPVHKAIQSNEEHPGHYPQHIPSWNAMACCRSYISHLKLRLLLDTVSAMTQPSRGRSRLY